MATPHRSSFGFVVILIALALAGGATWAWQWQQTLALRSSVELARLEATELAQLRAENARLRGRQIPAAELDQLRADHAALPRLRAELEAAKQATAGR